MNNDLISSLVLAGRSGIELRYDSNHLLYGPHGVRPRVDILRERESRL